VHGEAARHSLIGELRRGEPAQGRGRVGDRFPGQRGQRRRGEVAPRHHPEQRERPAIGLGQHSDGPAEDGLDRIVLVVGDPQGG
jgi:hypothetical protein